VIAIPHQLDPASLAEPGLGDTRRTLEGETMGTTWSAQFYAPASAPDAGFRLRIERELDRIDRQMSHWRPDSDLTLFNRAGAGQWRQLPEEFFFVLENSLRLAAGSGGAFDPALGDAADLWGFGPSGKRTRPASPAAGAPSGIWRSIALDPERRRARQPGGACLDLSSIAKGFAVDHLARCLEEEGARSCLVEIGGELRGSGVKEDRMPWWVSIEPPPGYAGEIRIALSGLAIATSGNYRRYFDYEGARYSHTLDPATRSPVVAPAPSVTVLHESCMEADAWSTALLVLGPVRGLALCEDRNLAAVFLVREKSSWRTLPSSAFQRMVEE